ncbi:MAG: ferrous iron transport protein B [Nitrososphaerales archaeon]|nr:ferrous iron transport protein B [Nitrososphaerales archaeon]
MEGIRIGLIGSPNSGKSTIFNNLTGFYQIVGNWPGKTVETVERVVKFKGRHFSLIDFPGTHTLTPTSMEEEIARQYMIENRPNVIIQVASAIDLERSIYLTLELIELGIPIVVALNQFDEAIKQGFEIDAEKLSEILGVPVIPTVAIRGEGIDKLVGKAFDLAHSKSKGKMMVYEDIGPQINKVMDIIKEFLPDRYPSEWFALKLFEEDSWVAKKIGELDVKSTLKSVLEEEKASIEKSTGFQSSLLIVNKRRLIAERIVNEVRKIKPVSRSKLIESLDSLSTSSYGYPLLAVVIATVFVATLGVGLLFRNMISYLFFGLSNYFAFNIANPLLSAILSGIQLSLLVGLSFIIPVVFLFHFFFSFLDDSGYLPRAVFLIDKAMRRIGLNGKAFMPLLLGYGCNVPACVTCRVLEGEKQRFVTALMITLIPCASRMIIICGLIAIYIGTVTSLAIYLFNLFVVLLIGMIVGWSVDLHCESTGLVMVLPPYRAPLIKNALRKTWARAKDFVYLAMPIIIIGTVFLKILEIAGIMRHLNVLFDPLFVGIFGLPGYVLSFLLFGAIRKEFALVFLMTTLNGNPLSYLSPNQIIVFTLITLFYIPCVATLTTLLREFRLNRTLIIVGINLLIAVIIGFSAHVIFSLIS